MLELIYTSAPDTLDGPGYGAVGKSDRFPIDLEKFIRKLCRYDFNSGESSTNSSDHPVVISHSIFRQASESWHVFSRVGFAGYDYTQRSVFLAHHVVLSAAEMSRNNVSEIFRLPDLFRTSWNEPAKLLPPRVLRTSDASPPTSSFWKKMTGYPGWGRVWAEKWQSTRNEPRFLIFPRGSDPLPLYLESLDQLEREVAEQTTFITNLTSDHSGPTYEWIGLVANSDMARKLERNSAGRVLNLAKPLGSPDDILLSLDKLKAKSQPKPPPQPPTPVVNDGEDDPLSENYIPEEYRIPQPATLPKSRPKVQDSFPSLPALPAIPRRENVMLKYAGIAVTVALMCVVMVIVMNQSKPKVEAPAAVDPAPALMEKANTEIAELQKKVENYQKDLLKKDGEVTSLKTQIATLSATPGPLPIKKDVQQIRRFVTRGISASDSDIKLVEIPELKGSDLKFKLLFPPGIGLVQSQPETLQLSLALENDPAATLQLLIKEGAVHLRASNMGNKSQIDQLLNCLRVSVLEIRSGLDIENPFVVQLGFTPIAQSVPISGLKPEDKFKFNSTPDHSALFLALNTWCSGDQKPVDCILRIRRVSSSILSSNDSNLDSLNGKEIPLKGPWTHAVSFSNLKPQIKGKFQITTHFNRNEESSKPAIAAELVLDTTERPKENSEVKVPTENSSKSGEESSEEAKEGTSPKSTPPAKGKNKTTPKPKIKEEPATETNAEDSPTVISDGKVVQEFFNRFGRLHADLVVRIPVIAESPTEIVILQIGE